MKNKIIKAIIYLLTIYSITIFIITIPYILGTQLLYFYPCGFPIWLAIWTIGAMALLAGFLIVILIALAVVSIGEPIYEFINKATITKRVTKKISKNNIYRSCCEK